MLKLKCYASPCEHMQQYAPHGIIPDHDAYEHYATTICLRSNFFKITTMQNIYIPHLSFSPKRIILYICAHPHLLSATISRRPLILPTQTRIAEYQDYGRNATQSEEADSDHIPLLLPVNPPKIHAVSLIRLMKHIEICVPKSIIAALEFNFSL